MKAQEQTLLSKKEYFNAGFPVINVLGVGIHATNLMSAVDYIGNAMRVKRQGYICVTGVHGVSEAQKDESFRKILNNAFLNTPDGMPMVWVGRLQGFKEMTRVYGPDLMLEVCKLSVEKGYTHFLYGGKDGVAELLRKKLTERFPSLKIVGTYTPPFRPLNDEEEQELIQLVQEAKPDIFWVGLSTPKQEKFMAEYINKLDTTLMIGVGAAFDIHSGQTKQAPLWMQQSGLEWLFRLLQEPKRLWRRYLINNPLFIAKILLQLTGLKKYNL